MAWTNFRVGDQELSAFGLRRTIRRLFEERVIVEVYR